MCHWSILVPKPRVFLNLFAVMDLELLLTLENFGLSVVTLVTVSNMSFSTRLREKKKRD